MLTKLSEERELGKSWISNLAVRAVSAGMRVIELSGGNQQKVVIAKSLAQEPQIIIFDEPNSWRRCWRDLRNPRNYQSPCRCAQSGGGHLVLPAGDYDCVRQNIGLPPGQSGRGIRSERGDGRPHHVCGGALSAAVLDGTRRLSR